MQHEALVDSGGKQLRMLAKDRRQMLAEALRIGHARCVVLFTIKRHTDTLSSGWFHGSDSLYGAVCFIHSIGLEVESSYCLHRFFTNHEIRWNQEGFTYAPSEDIFWMHGHSTEQDFIYVTTQFMS